MSKTFIMKITERWSHEDNEAEEENCDDNQKSTVQTGHYPLLQIQIQSPSPKNTNKKNKSPSPTNTNTNCAEEDRTFVTTKQIEISQNMNSDCVQSYAFTTRYLILTSFSNYFHWQDTLHTFLFVFDWSSRDIDLADPDLHLVLLEHSLKNFPFYANARLAKHYCDVWYPYMELWEDWKSTFKKYSI